MLPESSGGKPMGDCLLLPPWYQESSATHFNPWGPVNATFVPGAEDKHAQVWEGAAGWQWPVWYMHTMCHYFFFCSHDLWSGEQLQLHTLSFVRHYLILQREVYKLLAELWTW